MSIKTTLIKTFTALSIALCTLSVGYAASDNNGNEGGNITPRGGSTEELDPTSPQGEGEREPYDSDTGKNTDTVENTKDDTRDGDQKRD